VNPQVQVNPQVLNALRNTSNTPRMVSSSAEPLNVLCAGSEPNVTDLRRAELRDPLPGHLNILDEIGWRNDLLDAAPTPPPATLLLTEHLAHQT
jgi:hypothetical protein